MEGNLDKGFEGCFKSRGQYQYEWCLVWQRKCQSMAENCYPKEDAKRELAQDGHQGRHHILLTLG